MDPYQILGIDSNASEEEIQARYQALIEEYTKNQDETTQEKIKLLNSAYDILINKDIYKEVRAFIEHKNFAAAEAKLNLLSDRNSAEWNYLQGFVAVQKGWFESGLNYFKRSVEIDPNNIEYMNSLNTLQARVLDYASRYAQKGVKPQSQNNMNGCGGGNNGGNGGMC